ncbi:MAG: cobalamin-dependent protein [Gammaproteobacteria bacterium]|nr:cobalamin-dependent protein [Gammaproteobacteria bacterium]
MNARPTRNDIFPEPKLPDSRELIEEGRALARDCFVRRGSFLEHYDVDCEADYKRRCVRDSRLMMHAQIGYRDASKSRNAAMQIHGCLEDAGYRVDRYGICLDWSMGYPRSRRAGMPRGTGLILDTPQAFADLANSAPVACHFGDFMVGTPAALENTAAALAAGATTIGNLGQYFTFRQPGWRDDVATTAETVKALALIAAQPVEVLVHSNLDDGFAATLSDLASVAGMVLIERYIVGRLIGASVVHCYGHTFSNPLTRFAFQRVLAECCGDAPGSMVYGNTTSYENARGANYAHLAAYLLVDAQAQRTRPTGHALNPVPVTEAERIPEIEEIVDAHLFANTLLAGDAVAAGTIADGDDAEDLASRLVVAGERFMGRALNGLARAGVDTENAFEMLLSLRRLGSRGLEGLVASESGQPADADVVAPSPFQETLARQRERCLAEMDPAVTDRIRRAGLTGCVASSDVHEYGKRLIESLLQALGVDVIDGGVSVDPDSLAETARGKRADFIALSTYNGVALDYVRALIGTLRDRGCDIPVFVGGKLNQIPEDSNTAMPVDVSADLAGCGAIPCRNPREMISRLAGP